MNERQKKFENPIRLEELSPAETLKRIGFGENQILCDIGAGSGIFTIPAAQISKNTIYALEISEEMLSIISEKGRAQGLDNIELIHVQGDRFDLPDQCADMVLMVTVYHEIKNPEVFIAEVKRLLKENGKIVIIEFHKRQTPMGPPVERRLSKEEVIEKLAVVGLQVQQDFDLGDNYYSLVFGN